MPSDDLKQYVSSSQDFYALLGVESSATEGEIRRAYRQTARKYHPDKVGANNQEALDKFHQLQIAYDVLSDATVKELYDNARRAREEQKARQAAFQGRRKAMIDELEARENGASKRKREQMEEEITFERELQRLAEDGKRRRLAREEQLRQEFLKAEEEEHKAKEQATKQSASTSVDELDRTVAVRFQKNDRTAHLDTGRLSALFSRFGEVDAVVLKEKRRKPPGEKHKVDYWTGLIVFKSIVGAHAAVTDFVRVQSSEPDFGLLDSTTWASGQEPDAVPKIPIQPDVDTSMAQAGETRSDGREKPAQPPKFSFRPGNHAARTTTSDASLDDVTMMRLKNAERRRLEAKRQQEESSNMSTEEAAI